MLRKNSLLSLFLLGLATQSTAYGSTTEDEHIRQIVQGMMKEKDQKIQQFEARIRQLEQELKSRAATEKNQLAATPAPAEPAPPPESAKVPEPAKTVANDKNEETVSSKLQDLDKKIDELKESAAENGLEIKGFFDVNAKTGNATDKTFSIGSVELDMDYAYDDHFGASTALVFDGEDTTEIAVALIDFHSFDDRIPPRGRIFNNQGFHVQAGRFDLPFGTDYQNFASKDRVTVTAPLTTTRMQLDGYNGNGVRSYGSWDIFNYAAFWTDAMYAEDGNSIGGRLGVVLGQKPYTIHHTNQENIEFGVSHLSELNGDNHIRNSVYGADLSVNYGMLRWQNEVMLLQAHQGLTLEGEPVHDDRDNPIGKGHQLGYHSTLIADLESVIKQPVLAFARFSRWQPKQGFGLDHDDSVVAINDISMLSIGFNYKFSEHLQLKFEYNDSLGTSTKEHYFDKKVGTGQMVISF